MIKTVKKWRGFRSDRLVLASFSALLLLVLCQCAIFLAISGSVGGMAAKLGSAWLNILRNNSYAGIIALGMCFAIISGGIDLSVGSMLCALGALLMYLIEPNAGLLRALGITGVPAYILGIALTFAAGSLLGCLNGMLASYGRIPPFIATLGTMKIFRSVTQQLTKTFNPTVPDGFKKIASLKIGGQVFLPILYSLAAVALM